MKYFQYQIQKFYRGNHTKIIISTVVMKNYKNDLKFQNYFKSLQAAHLYAILCTALWLESFAK